MDSDLIGLRGTVKLPWRGVEIVLHKVTFSLRKVVLAAKKEGSCY